MHTKEQLRTRLAQAGCQLSGPETVPQGLPGRIFLIYKWQSRLCEGIGSETGFARMNVQMLGRESGKESVS